MSGNSFATKSTNDLLLIIGAGGGIVLDAQTRTTNDLLLLAGAARSKGVAITLRGLSMKSTNDLLLIAGAGAGHVLLEG